MANYLAQLPVVWRVLLSLIGLDILTGVLAGFITRTLSARTMFTGMGKKALILSLVVATEILSRVSALDESFDIHLGSLVALFYCLYEMLSIVENAQRCGIPLPGKLVEALEKARASSEVPKPPAP